MDQAKPAAGALTAQQVASLITQSPDFAMAYFNHARVATTYSDVRIFLGQNSLSPAGQQTFQEELCVIFSPEFARTFAKLLDQILNQYEKTFGPIRPNPAMVTPPVVSPTKAGS